jgi:hypothetical protein
MKYVELQGREALSAPVGWPRDQLAGGAPSSCRRALVCRERSANLARAGPTPGSCHPACWPASHPPTR